MTTVTNEERLEKVGVVHYEEDEDGNYFALLKEDDYCFLKEQAEQAQVSEREKEYFRRNLVELKAEEVVTRKENARLQELVKILKVHAVHCDADERAIQPYEIIDVINEFTTGEVNGQR